MIFLNLSSLNIYKNKTVDQLSKYYDSIKKLKSLILEVVTNLNITNQTVLLKPNWVRHPINETDNLCLTTHNNFIFAALEIILEKNPRRIIIGDAPIQVCKWGELVDKNFYNKIDEYSKKFNKPITIKDFRRVILNKEKNIVQKNRKDLSNYVIFDMAEKSYLEPISSDKQIFRVTDYDPRRLAISHSIGKHKYCISKELFEADVVISLPKLKTHQKTGITCALKNLVGFNGDKDFLPHHRVGGTGFGGDCYPGQNYIRRLAEYFLDNANKNIGNMSYPIGKFCSKAAWKLSNPDNFHHLDAGWYGNDTSWRMVLDINMIAAYGKIDGSISEIPQRKIYSLCDGIIAGQGNGPLHPEPLPLGILCFSNNSALTDVAMAKLLGFDVNKIKLVLNSNKIFPYKKHEVKLNGKLVNVGDLDFYAWDTKPPPGWIGHIKIDK